LSCKLFKAELKGGFLNGVCCIFVAGFCVTKMTIARSPMTGNFKVGTNRKRLLALIIKNISSEKIGISTGIFNSSFPGLRRQKKDIPLSSTQKREIVE